METSSRDRVWTSCGAMSDCLVREPRRLGCCWGEAVRQVPRVGVLGGWSERRLDGGVRWCGRSTSRSGAERPAGGGWVPPSPPHFGPSTPPCHTPYCPHTTTTRGAQTQRGSAVWVPGHTASVGRRWFRPSLSPNRASWPARLSAHLNLPTPSQNTSHFLATPRTCGLSNGGWCYLCGHVPKGWSAAPLCTGEGTRQLSVPPPALGPYLALKRHLAL